MFSAEWIKFLTSSRRKSYFSSENVRNYKRVVLKIFEKTLGKIPFCDSHIRTKIQNYASQWEDFLQYGQMEVSFK